MACRCAVFASDCINRSKTDIQRLGQQACDTQQIPAISEYVDKRFDTLEKFFEDDTTVVFDLELAKTTNHHKNGDIFKAEVHIIAKGKNVYATAEKEDLYAAIDIVKDEVLREEKTLKEERQSFIRRGGSQMKDIIKGFWPGKKN